ncbi:MAG: peptidylprolyl isomerase, partial [Planctomycetes bacterium]|nr:peptidylprolyl isomerase [Planctomycetota bacterium]
MKRFIHPLHLFLILLLLAPAVQADRTVVRVKTNFGDIIIELFVDESPITVENFLDYANGDFYDGLIFHRVIENFVIQAGAYDPNLYVANPNNDPDFFRNPLWIRDPNFFHTPNDSITNESSNGISNLRGTIAMALVGGNPNSATSQFFINLSNANAFLENQQFTVFVRVTSVMER